MTNLPLRSSTGPLLFGLIAACAIGAATTHATEVPDDGSPSFEVSELDGGHRLVQWISPTRWDEIVDEEADVLSVPLGEGQYANALILAPWIDVADVIEEVEEVEEPTPPPAGRGEEIAKRKKYDLSYKFFAGDTKDKNARSRIKGARKYYVAAFAWWAKQIHDSCKFDVQFDDLGNDIKTLKHQIERKGRKVDVGYSRYTTHEKWARGAKYTWLIGAKKRDRLLRSPSPQVRFHLAIFKADGIRWLRWGKENRAEHVHPKPGIGIFRRPLLNRQNTAIHETGHFLGLRDGDGAIMTYAKKSAQKGGSQYGKKKFRKSWCAIIEKSIQPPV